MGGSIIFNNLQRKGSRFELPFCVVSL